MKKNLKLERFVALADVLKAERKPSFLWDHAMVSQLWPQCVNYSVWSPEGDWEAIIVGQELASAFEILLLLTRPMKKRSGLMKNLLSEVVKDLDMNHKEEIWLEVHESNLAARNLYKNSGFVEVGSRPKYYSDGGNAILCSFFLKNE